MKRGPKHIHIDCTGMTDDERTVAMLSAILENINLPQKRKKKAKEIRQENKDYEKRRKKRK